MRKSLIPVILIVAVAALCLSAASVGDDGQTGERSAMDPFGDPTFYTVSGTVTVQGSSPVQNIEGATVILSSLNETYSTTTDASGGYWLSAVPGTYDLTVKMTGYNTFTDSVTVSSSSVLKNVGMTAKTSVNGATVTGYVMALDDFARYSGTGTSIKLYYRTSDTETTDPSDYKSIQSTSSIDVSDGSFTIDGVKYGNDTLVDRCYIAIDVGSYEIVNYSSCITGSVTIHDPSKDIVLYRLNENISSTGSFEDNGSYSLGSTSSACITMKPTDGTISGTVTVQGSSPTKAVSGAAVIFSSEMGTYSTTTNANGEYLLYVVPGTYDMTVSKNGYVTLIEKDITIGANIVKPITIKEKTNVNGATLTGYVMALDDFARISGSAVSIKLYYRTTETESSLFSDYVEIQSTSSINSGTFTINGVKYDAAAYKDTIVDRCYLRISIDTYSVSDVSASYFMGKKVFTDPEGVMTTLYRLNSSISETGSFEDNGSYSIGSTATAGIILDTATGTISGTMGTIGTITITDSSGIIYGQGDANSDGKYSFTSYVGKDLTITYSSVGYKSKILSVTVYDDTVSPDKNKQAEVKLTEIETGKAYVKVYVDGKTSSISDMGQTKFVLYQLLNPTEPDTSKRNYRAIAEYSGRVITDTVKDKINGYYIEFNINGNVNCSDCFLSVQMNGYSVRSVQSKFMELTPTIITSDEVSTNRLKSDISTNGRFETGHEYSIGTCSSDAMLIDKATGTVKGDVVTNTENPTILNGVKVSIIDKEDDSVVAYGITSDRGNYSITVNTGEYTIRYEIEGYVTYETTIRVYDESIYGPEKNVQPTVKLDAEKGEWFGMDLPHALLMVGGIIAVILIIAVLFHRFRILDKKNKVIYEDDDEEERR